MFLHNKAGEDMMVIPMGGRGGGGGACVGALQIRADHKNTSALTLPK